MNAMPSGAQGDWLADFPPPRSLPLDQEALRVYERAYTIGLLTESKSEPPVTFSTVALALLTGEDETSRWFARLAKANGPTLDDVCREKGTTAEALPSAGQPPGRPAAIRLSADKQLLTSSARAVLETAEEWANRVGGSDIGIRHLVASYVLNPPAAHRQQMNGWGFRERAWRDAFFDWIAERYTAEAWSDARQKVAPTKALAAFEPHLVKGAQMAFLGTDATKQVLALAASLHARRDDTWLRLQTVVFALVELAQGDNKVRMAVAPLWNAVQQAADRYRTAFDAYLPQAQRRRAIVPFDQLDISPRVLNGLETARGLALASGRDDAGVGILQLAGAMVSRRVDGDEDLVAMGLDPSALRLALIDHGAANDEPAEVWREALGEEEAAPAGRPVDLNSDEPEAVVRADEKWTNDPLGIRPDVASFASLLASRTLEPPLAIGLFGPWGSGKTTFLKRLRRAIDDRTAQAQEARGAGQPTPFVSNVAHVEFNAWHFAEDALISSLVDTIVREIRSFIRNDCPPVGEALARFRSETAETSRRRMESARQEESAARAAVETASKTLVDSRASARDGATSLEAAARAAWTATVAAFKDAPVVKDSRVLEQLGAGVSGVEDLQARIRAMRTGPASRMLGGLGWTHTLVFAGLVLALPPTVAWVVKGLLGTGEAGTALASASAILSVAGVWLRTAAGAAGKVERAIAEVSLAYEERIRSDPGVKAANERVEQATKAAEAAAQALAAAERDLRHAEAAAAAASQPAQMLALAGRRADEMTYAKDLTTISVARGDLQTLSQILREQAGAATGGSAGLRPVDRVILYIDDLDRCRPEDVVRVLQVVHMLLAFELFVVVVAVDARWVEESLKQNYRWLAGADDGQREPGNDSPAEAHARVTPQDYLEKIFQISFWLEPMTAGRAAEYLKSLVRTPRREAGPVTGVPAAGPTPDGAGRVEIQPIELDYLRALAAYLGPSPRRVKRLVNAYRLLKARMSDAQLRGFLTDRRTDDGTLRSGPYQWVIGLLVIGTGAPASAAQILVELAERDPRDGLEQVIDSLRERRHSDWTMAAQVLETLLRTQKSRDVSELRGWARKVGRFMLQGPSEVLKRPAGNAPP